MIRQNRSGSRAGILIIAGAWAFFTGSRPVHAAEADPWFGRDKAWHYGLSTVIAGGGYGVAAVVTPDRRWRVLAGGGLGLAAGIGKEAFDASGAGDPSWRDLTWDVLGTATGVAVAVLIDWLVSR